MRLVKEATRIINHGTSLVYDKCVFCILSEAHLY